MTKESKTHFRKVFKSDHLGISDLEDLLESGKRLIFTIKEAKQEYGIRVAGSLGDYNIIHFEEDIKPLVVNATNGKTLKKITGSPYLEDWKGFQIELYIDEKVSLMKEIVGGVRIKASKQKDQLTPEHYNWQKAKIQVKENDVSIDQIRKKYIITEENYKLLCG